MCHLIQQPASGVETSQSAFNRPGVASIALACAGGMLLSVASGGVPVVAGLLVLVCALALRPANGLFLVALTLPFYLYQKSIGSMAFSVPELTVISTMAGAGINAVWGLRRGLPIRLGMLATSLDAPIALFLAASLLSLLASEVLRVSLRDLRTLIIEPVAAYYLVVWLLRRDQVQVLVLALVAGGTAAAALGLYQYLFTSHVVAVEGARRVLGPYLSPNQLGLYLGRTIPIALAATLFVPRFRLPAFGVLLVLVAALGLTFSVGAWLASFMAVAMVVLLWKRRAIVALLGVLAVAGLAAIPVLRMERFASHLDLSRGTSFIRLQLWESSIAMIRDHPLLGVGMDNFLYHYRTGYILPEAAAEPNLSHPHNLVLNFWLQTGVLGLAAFLWLGFSLARMWNRIWRLERSTWGRAILAGIAGVAIDFVAHGMVDNSYFLVDMAYHFWLLGGVVVVMERSIE